MSAYINEVTLMGNLGRKPELKRFADGTANLRVSVATTEKWRDKVSGELFAETEWHSVILKGSLAEVVAEYMDSGDKIWVRGRSKTRQYTDDNGIERFINEVHARDMKIIFTRSNKEESSEVAQEKEEEE